MEFGRRESILSLDILQFRTHRWFHSSGFSFICFVKCTNPDEQAPNAKLAWTGIVNDPLW